MIPAAKLVTRLTVLATTLDQAAVAASQSDRSAWSAGDGFSWWQAAGGTLVVFALLLLCLRVLRRLGTGGKGGQASLLAVWPLGPRREIEVVRFRDQVHYLYRHEGALVALCQEPLATFQVNEAGRSGEAAPWKNWQARLLRLASNTTTGNPATKVSSDAARPDGPRLTDVLRT